ncbi:MAG: hypothetical protein V4858_09425 [Pseudomonadota bacterium]
MNENLSIRFVKIGVTFLVLGIFLGVVMHHQHTRALVPLHAHVTLVGGFLMIIFGLIYQAFPAMAKSKLAAWHFWLFTASSLSLSAFATREASRLRTFDDANEHGASMLVAILGLTFLTSLILLVINVFKNGKVAHD